MTTCIEQLAQAVMPMATLDHAVEVGLTDAQKVTYKWARSLARQIAVNAKQALGVTNNRELQVWILKQVLADVSALGSKLQEVHPAAYARLVEAHYQGQREAIQRSLNE